MPNPQPKTEGLRPNPKALGVEPLAEGELSRPVRIRASREVHERLKGMSAAEIGKLLEKALKG